MFDVLSPCVVAELSVSPTNSSPQALYSITPCRDHLPSASLTTEQVFFCCWYDEDDDDDDVYDGHYYLFDF